MAKLTSKLFSILSPKKASKKGGVSATATYNPQQADRALTAPQYREHLEDVYSIRTANNSQELLNNLFQQDPDVSAAVNAYLTMANTIPTILVRDMDHQIDKDATRELLKQIKFMTVPTDYTLGFQMKHTLQEWCEEMRYMCLLRGAIGVELVLNDKLMPADLRTVDMASIEWFEKKPGDYKPRQKVSGNNDGIDLDIPTFFVSFYRQDPTKIYSYSPFVSTINTIAARQQVINDLYRIMRKTGYPRLDVEVIEETLMKNLPPAYQTDEVKKLEWVNSQMSSIRQVVEGIRTDQAFIHTDSIKPSILNDKNPGVAVDITSVIETLNAQNQAGLKTMATVIGRGRAGVNTGSVEARVASMNADELNYPLAAVLSNVFSFILHQTGYQGFAEVKFPKSELRPDLELEPQITLRAQRLRQDLSDGLITDLEYHLEMYGRLPPDDAPELSGTGFIKEKAVEVDAKRVSPNGDPLGRSLSPEGKHND